MVGSILRMSRSSLNGVRCRQEIKLQTVILWGARDNIGFQSHQKSRIWSWLEGRLRESISIAYNSTESDRNQFFFQLGYLIRLFILFLSSFPTTTIRHTKRNILTSCTLQLIENLFSFFTNTLCLQVFFILKHMKILLKFL